VFTLKSKTRPSHGIPNRGTKVSGPMTRNQLDAMADAVPSPVWVSMLEIDAEICSETLFQDYVDAFIQECEVRHPMRAEKVAITKEELLSYCKFLLAKRVALVRRTITDAGKLRDLYVPDFIQVCLEAIGECVSMELAVSITPTFTAEVMTLDEAYEVSKKLARWSDVMRVNRDALPRSTEGDVEVMSSILAENHVRSMKDIHPTSVIVSAFLGLTVQKELLLSTIYKVEYRHASSIRRAVLQREEFF